MPFGLFKKKGKFEVTPINKSARKTISTGTKNSVYVPNRIPVGKVITRSLSEPPVSNQVTINRKPLLNSADIDKPIQNAFFPDEDLRKIIENGENSKRENNIQEASGDQYEQSANQNLTSKSDDSVLSDENTSDNYAVKSRKETPKNIKFDDQVAETVNTNSESRKGSSNGTKNAVHVPNSTPVIKGIMKNYSDDSKLTLNVNTNEIPTIYEPVETDLIPDEDNRNVYERGEISSKRENIDRNISSLDLLPQLNADKNKIPTIDEPIKTDLNPDEDHRNVIERGEYSSKTEIVDRSISNLNLLPPLNVDKNKIPTIYEPIKTYLTPDEDHRNVIERGEYTSKTVNVNQSRSNLDLLSPLNADKNKIPTIYEPIKTYLIPDEDHRNVIEISEYPSKTINVNQSRSNLDLLSPLNADKNKIPTIYEPIKTYLIPDEDQRNVIERGEYSSIAENVDRSISNLDLLPPLNADKNKIPTIYEPVKTDLIPDEDHRNIIERTKNFSKRENVDQSKSNLHLLSLPNADRKKIPTIYEPIKTDLIPDEDHKHFIQRGEYSSKTDQSILHKTAVSNFFKHEENTNQKSNFEIGSELTETKTLDENNAEPHTETVTKSMKNGYDTVISQEEYSKHERESSSNDTKNPTNMPPTKPVLKGITDNSKFLRSNSDIALNSPDVYAPNNTDDRTFIEITVDLSKEENDDQRISRLEVHSDKSPSRLTDVSNSSLYGDQSARNSFDSQLSDFNTKAEPRVGIIPKTVKYDAEVANSLVKYPKTEREAEFIREAITKNEFMSKVITGKRLDDVVDAMYVKDIKPKEKIIKEGTTGTNMYVVAQGEFEVLKKGTRGQVAVIKPGDVFGELAILYNAKRLATVKSLTPAKVWVIDNVVYQQLMKKSDIEEKDEIVSFLRDIEILNEASVQVLERVGSILVSETFEAGKVIVREGEQGDKFYIIAAGSVTVTREDESFTGKLHRGKCFGEKALLEDSPRQATVTADPPLVECLTLTRKQFIDHFGTIEDISKISVPPQNEYDEVVIIDDEYLNLDLQNFKILKTLGVGGFGRVEFIQHKKHSSKTFALKYLKKYEMVQQEQEQHVINEMRIQMTCKSPFIIRMHRTFKDNKYIYFLMEVCLGGDLWSLLQKQPNKRFEEKGARFIGGCVLEALTYIHKKGYVYRDLKPENLLIASNGYIKITDFGFAKRLANNTKTTTFAGTPEYVAPEIILNRGHDKAVDYWAYGIFIYEILNGRTPFKSNDPSYMKTYNKILSGLDIVAFPSHDSSKAKSLISKLLKKKPEERLGYSDNGEEIRSHKWFGDFDWNKLRDCRMSSPYKPTLSSNVDFRYIDFFKKDNDIPPDETSDWDRNF